ncbi:TrmH family RNA methyltransferase [Kribbella sindirgiensis]|uniref:RNA methyltransferase n=1 Tax=Kribbella sindirgiensis TaxID=1124744 RepID=A0A4R0J2S2_9ACTN|nr:RNA methyltransferase [Kribbella sindirgiensis]TCC39374.1 RNA methyltransferase [Kribbella sindirgiensis]
MATEPTAQQRNASLIKQFKAAYRQDDLVVLEGFHAVKHALRFGARILAVISDDPAQVERLGAALAPDTAGPILSQCVHVDPETFRLATRSPIGTRIVAVASKSRYSEQDIARRADRPVVGLEDPRNMGNVGAVIRLAAACDIAGVIAIGEAIDPWHVTAVRGSAGLHYALPVIQMKTLKREDRPIVGIDPIGEQLWNTSIPANSVLVFGTERYGLSDALLSICDTRVSIPMRPGVSSLNLATAVAAVLYGGNLAESDR